MAAADRQFELEELINRPGTYFNPQTEVLVVVDDSASLDQEIFNLEDFEGADWVLISDDPPIDEARRDELVEGFQARHSGGDGRGEIALDEEDEQERLDAVDADEDPEPEGVEEVE
jgi:phosphoribosylaminoimidazole carboxylase (NCAIR synthetase)